MAAKILAFIGFLILAAFPAHGQSFERQLWAGDFEQTSPLSWSGSMELYIRFEAESDLPRPFEGVLVWKGLGAAKTRIVGTMTDSGISFQEKACLAGNCSKVVLGGNYQAKYSRNGSILKGNASLKSQGLSGTFELKKTLLH